MPLEAGDYLLDALDTAGRASPGLNGAEPLSWSEVWAFACATGDHYEPWELETLVAMSRAYVAGLTAGDHVFSIPPYDPDDPA